METARKISDRIRTISASSDENIQYNNQQQAESYVENRQNLVDDAAICIKHCKNVVKELRNNQQLDRPTAKRAHKELDESDVELLKERATLAANRVKLTYGILAHPTHSRLGEAYLSCIVENLPEPAGARFHKQGSRSGTDQSNFRQRVFKDRKSVV